VRAEPERLVEPLRRRVLLVAARVDHRADRSLLREPLKRERANRRREAATPELRVRSDRLELADAILVVEPREAVRGDRAARRDGDRVEIATVGPSLHHVAVALDRDARRMERAAVRLDARLHVALLHRPQLESVGRNGRRQSVEVPLEVRHERRVGGAHEAAPLEHGDRVGVRVQRVGLARLRPVEHLLEQLAPLGMHAEVEDAALEEPAVRNDAPVLLPEHRLPARLAADMLEARPREVADVLRPLGPAQRPRVLHEPLHAAQVVGALVVACRHRAQRAHHTSDRLLVITRQPTRTTRRCRRIATPRARRTARVCSASRGSLPGS
jgi:hypothetical protein